MKLYSFHKFGIYSSLPPNRQKEGTLIPAIDPKQIVSVAPKRTTKGTLKWNKQETKTERKAKWKHAGKLNKKPKRPTHT